MITDFFFKSTLFAFFLNDKSRPLLRYIWLRFSEFALITIIYLYIHFYKLVSINHKMVSIWTSLFIATTYLTKPSSKRFLHRSYHAENFYIRRHNRPGNLWEHHFALTAGMLSGFIDRAGRNSMNLWNIVVDVDVACQCWCCLEIKYK